MTMVVVVVTVTVKDTVTLWVGWVELVMAFNGWV